MGRPARVPDMNHAAVPVDTDRPTTEAAVTAPAPSRATEAVHVRNYDHRAGHSVRVTVDRHGDVRLTARHYLRPGQSVRVTGSVDAGEHRVRVWVDGVERERADCRLDDTPAGTAVVEIGNGVVSLTDGATAVSAPD